MEISHPNQRELTPEAMQELEDLKALLEQAVADGRLTRAERDRIHAMIWADGKPTFQELELVRAFVQEKVASGELQIEYS